MAIRKAITRSILDATILPADISPSVDFTFNSVLIGKGGGAVGTNTVVGANALSTNATGANNEIGRAHV